MTSGGAGDVAEMVVMGLDVAVLAPLLYLVTRRWLGWDRLALPAVLALPTYLLAHAALTIGMDVVMPTWALDIAFQAGLVLVGVGFWLPVLGERRRLSDAGAVAYLFLGMPSMDLAGVAVVLRGDPAGGIAMIVGMLPLGVYAVAAAWRWIVTEERELSAAPDIAISPAEVPLGLLQDGRTVW